MPSADLSGFCGLTSHQSSSRSSAWSAAWLTCRCPACAGLKEPPKRPTRRCRRRLMDGSASTGAAERRIGRCLGLWRGVKRSGPQLPGAMDPIFERGELLDSDGPAGVELARLDADLGAHAELAAIVELGRGVVEHHQIGRAHV